MVKINHLIILFLFVVLLPSLHAAEAKDYLNEFNTSSENCSIIDAFLYKVYSAGFLFDGYSTTVPVFYDCCSGGTCTPIIFDVYNENLLDNVDVKELIDLNYIKVNLNNGVLSEKQFISNGVDVCDSFGQKKLNQESVNLAANAVESSTPLMKAETAYKVTQTIETARRLNVIGKFNPTVLVASVACKHDNKVLNQVVESLATCNAYMANIRNSFAQSYYVESLDNCITIAKTRLKSYIDSATAQVRGIINWILNLLYGLFKPIFDVISNPSGPVSGFKIEKTEFEIAQDIYKEISGFNANLRNPNNADILKKYSERIEEKQNEYNKEYLIANQKYDEVKIIKPSTFKIFITNLFKEPNYNISEGMSYLDDAVNFKSMSEASIKKYRFNTAINQLKLADTNFDNSKSIVSREENIKRKFDKRWLIAVIIVLVFLGSVFYILKRNKKDGYA